MSRQDGKRPGLPEARTLKIDLPVDEAIRHMFSYGRLRKNRKGSVSKSEEEVRDRHQDEARTAGTHRNGPRLAKP